VEPRGSAEKGRSLHLETTIDVGAMVAFAWTNQGRDHPLAQTWQWWPSAVNRTEYAAYGLHMLWAPAFLAHPAPPQLEPFWASTAVWNRGDVSPLNGGLQALDISEGPVNVGQDQDYLQDVAGATVAAWVKVVKGSLIAPENYVYVSSAPPSSRLHLQVRGQGTPQSTGTLATFLRRVDTDKSASLFSTSTISFDQWTHIAVVVDYVGGTYRFYIDGSDAGAGSTGLSLGRSQDTPTPENWVGAGSGGTHLPGLIDDVRVYNRRLSSNDVRSLSVPTELDQARTETGKLSGEKSGLVVHYQFEEMGSRVTDLANPDGTATPADDGVLTAASGWVFMGNEDLMGPRWNFDSGPWDLHGHAWRHKHSMTLRGWGQHLMIERNILSYSDVRSEYTQKTKAYNVFSLVERDQSPAAGRGGRVQVAEDLGPIAVVQSDNATAWSSGVQRAVRRAIMFRPAMMVVHDDVVLSEEKTAVQTWTSLRPWEVEQESRCVSRIGGTAVRLHGVVPPDAELVTSEDSVSEEKEGVVPVYRAAFVSPAAKQHDLLTVIEAIGPGVDERQSALKLLDGGGIELRQQDDVARIFLDTEHATTLAAFGFSSDGRLLVVSTRAGRPVAAAAFDATWLEGPEGIVRGSGFLQWTVPDRDCVGERGPLGPRWSRSDAFDDRSIERQVRGDLSIWTSHGSSTGGLTAPVRLGLFCAERDWLPTTELMR